MPIRKQLPAPARVDQLKKQAKNLSGDAVTMKRVVESHPRHDPARASTVPAKLPSWTKLRRRVRDP